LGVLIDRKLAASIVLYQEFPEGDASDRIERSWIDSLKTVIKKRQGGLERWRYGLLRAKRRGILPENVAGDHDD